MNKSRAIWLAASAATGVLAGLAAPSGAAIRELENGNSVIRFDTDYDPDAGHANGMFDWVVDGVDHMHQQWFWFRTGEMDHEAPVDTLSLVKDIVTDTDGDQLADFLFLRYAGEGFAIDFRFSLQGGLPGSGVSDIGEQILVRNTGRNPLSLSFFQYNDADLNGTVTDTRVRIGEFVGGLGASQMGDGVVVHETVVTPAADHYEAGVFSTTRDSLNDDSITTLNDNDEVLGPADLTWAFQWDFVLSPGDSENISKDKRLAVVPAPGAMLLGLLGMGFTGLMRRRMA